MPLPLPAIITAVELSSLSPEHKDRARDMLRAWKPDTIDLGMLVAILTDPKYTLGVEPTVEPPLCQYPAWIPVDSTVISQSPRGKCDQCGFLGSFTEVLRHQRIVHPQEESNA